MKNIRRSIVWMGAWLLSVGALAMHEKPVPQDSRFAGIMKEADVYMADYDVVHATPLYENAFRISPQPVVARRLSKCYFSRGYYRNCLEILRSLPADSVGHQDMRMAYDCYDNLSMSDSALACGRLIAAKYAYDSENIANMAGYFNSINNTDSVLSYTQRYRMTDTTNLFVNRQQAYAYYNAKNFRKGMEEYGRLISLGDSSLYSCFRMGLCCNGCDSVEKAYPYFLKAAELSHYENPNILTQLGKACISIGRVDEGIDCLSKALMAAYSSLDVLFVLNSSIGDAFFKKHDYSMAILYLRNAQRYKSQSYATDFKIGQAYELDNKMASAKETYLSLLGSLEKIDHPSEGVQTMTKMVKDRLFLLNKVKAK